MRLALIAGGLLLCAALGEPQAYRLPTSIIPQRYNVSILTNLGDENDLFEFTGSVAIQATVVEATRNVTLHAKHLDIDVSAIEINDDKHAVESTHVDAEHEFYTIVLKAPLAKDAPLKIYVAFKGQLDDGLAGYYRSSYQDSATKQRRYLAVTQFEPTDARRAFPCFDEPEMKAKFTISMGHKDAHTALSNMNEVGREPIAGKAGWSWTHFAETVPMSTYLVAFMVSDFGFAAGDGAHGNTTFRIWARRDALPQAQLAAEVGPRALAYFERFFGIAYPLPKQDMAAIPDFNAGAMENWGLITYRETALLYDAAASSAASQQAIAATIAHELAHQWFGNLVTMRWWTDLWLNEGFATYMAALAVDHLRPEWNYLSEEAVASLLAVFDLDALQSSHPVSVPIGHPREIGEIFDAIAYRKGSYILRMMSLFLGEETLRRGVRSYLEQHRYGSAAQDDLWASLTEEAHRGRALPANLTVKLIMDTWTLQTGYPVVSVRRDYEANKAEVRQRRFVRDAQLARSGALAGGWWVPLTYTDARALAFNDTTPRHYLPDSGEPLSVAAPKPEEFLLFNVQIAGLYRVNYDERNWRLLSDYLRSERFRSIPAVNRIQLLEDAAALAWTGDLSYGVFFGMLDYLRQEDGYLPWRAALSSLDELQRQVRRTSNYGMYKTYVRQLIVPAYARFGRLSAPLADEQTPRGVQRIKLQALVASTACKFKVEECVADARRLFADYVRDPVKHSLPKNLRAIITCNAVRFGGEEEWEHMWKEYLASNVATVKDGILGSLGCTSEPWLLRRYLERTLQADSGIRKQDFVAVFRSVARNQYGFHIAKDFLGEEIANIAKFLYPNGRRLTRCISPLASQMITQSEYDWFVRLTQNNSDAFKDAQQGVRQGLETIKLNLQWQRTHQPEIKQLISLHI